MTPDRVTAVAGACTGVLLTLHLFIGLPAIARGEPTVETGHDALAAAETIMILPVALPDAYEVADRDKLEAQIYKMLVRKLALKGYVLDRPRNWQRPEPWTSELIAAMSREQMAAVAPAIDGLVAILLVESITHTSQVAQSEAESVVSVTLMEPATGKPVWRNRGYGRFYENLFSGWLTMLITPDRTAALEKAFSKLFEDLPERP